MLKFPNRTDIIRLSVVRLENIFMKTIFTAVTLLTLFSCVSVNMPMPNEFKDHATRMPVKGMQGWMINQKLSFANFQTTSVKRGWDFTSSVQHTKFNMRPEEYLLKVYNINTDKRRDNQRNKFQYAMQDGRLMTEVYATEKFHEEQLVYKSNNPWIGKVHNSQYYEYAFTAAIVPLNFKNNNPWSLVLISKSDRRRYGRYHDRYTEEEGYATNGRENIAISPLRSATIMSRDQEEIQVAGGKIFTGYELRIDNELVAVVDLLDSSVWMHNELRPENKIIVASVASALLLKRIHDPERHEVNG